MGPGQHQMFLKTSLSCVTDECVLNTDSGPVMLDADLEHSKTLDLQELTDLAGKGRDIANKEKLEGHVL